MRKRTKLVSLILAGITMLSFAACTKTETPPPQYNAETIESTEHLATGSVRRILDVGRRHDRQRHTRCLIFPI